MAIVNKRQGSGVGGQQKRGPLVRVEITPGRFVKMYQEDAPPLAPPTPQGGEKSLPAPENKMRLPGEDKSGGRGPGAGGQEEPPADFTIIAGVGQATARALKARGIRTFEQLRAAGQLSFVSGQTMQAIEKWRQSGG